MTPFELAKHYFDLSNRSDMGAIRALMDEGTTYSSQNTGVFLGVDDIMKMQTAFHGSFERLNWDVTKVEEIKPGIVRFEFVLSGMKKTGEEIRTPGVEFVVVQNGKLRHIEVRNVEADSAVSH